MSAVVYLKIQLFMDKGWYSHTVRILLAKRNPYLLTGNCGENHKLKAVGILSHI